MSLHLEQHVLCEQLQELLRGFVHQSHLSLEMGAEHGPSRGNYCCLSSTDISGIWGIDVVKEEI